MPFPSGDFPFQNMLADLMKLMNQGSLPQWEMARQLATAVASDGTADPNVDPLDRIRLEELGRIAELNVAEVTGLDLTSGGRPLVVRPLTRTEWAVRTLESWQPVLEPLSDAGGLSSGDDPALPSDLTEDEPTMKLFEALSRMVRPAMLGIQLGSSVGHLARRAMGQYAFPIPRPLADEISVVPANIEAFAEDWSLPGDDLRMWVCTSEMAHHAVFRLPHVRSRFEELLSTYVAGYRPGTSGIAEQLAETGLSDLSKLQEIMGDPTGVMREQESPDQTAARERLEAAVAALEGYVDHVTDTVGSRVIGSLGPLAEALRRRRVDRDAGERFMEQLFGLELDQAQFDRGTAFVRGVLDRAGEEGLSKLWSTPGSLPTPAEIAAPGLWLERIAIQS